MTEIDVNFKSTLAPRKRAKTKEEKEQRRVERILRNRRAAHASREKKRKYVQYLETYVSKLEENLKNASENFSILSSHVDLNQYQLLSKSLKPIENLSTFRQDFEASCGTTFGEKEDSRYGKEEPQDDADSPVNVKLEEDQYYDHQPQQQSPTFKEEGSQEPEVMDKNAVQLYLSPVSINSPVNSPINLSLHCSKFHSLNVLEQNSEVILFSVVGSVRLTLDSDGDCSARREGSQVRRGAVGR